MGGFRPNLILLGALALSCGASKGSSSFDAVEENTASGGSGGNTSNTNSAGGSGTTSATTTNSSNTNGGESTSDGGSGGTSTSSISDTASSGGTTSAITNSTSSTTTTTDSTSMGGSSTSDTTTGTETSSTTGEDSTTGAGGSTVIVDAPVEIADSCDFSACGGELANTSWQYTRVCIEEGDLLGVIESACAGVELVDTSGSVNGTLTFDETTVTQEGSITLDASFLLPATCVLGTCQATGLLVAAVLPGTTCVAAGSGCTCTVALENQVDETDDYSASGNELQIGDQTGQYCAESGSLGYTADLNGVPLHYEAEPF